MILLHHLRKEWRGARSVLLIAAGVAPLLAFALRDKAAMPAAVACACALIALLGVGTDLACGDRMDLLRRLPAGLVQPLLAKLVTLVGCVVMATLYAMVVAWLFDGTRAFAWFGWIPAALVIAIWLFAASCWTQVSGYAILAALLVIAAAATPSILAQKLLDASMAWPFSIEFNAIVGASGSVAAAVSFLALRRADARRLSATLGVACSLIPVGIFGIQLLESWRCVLWANPLTAQISGSCLISVDGKRALVTTRTPILRSRRKASHTLLVDLETGEWEQLGGEGWSAVPPTYLEGLSEWPYLPRTYGFFCRIWLPRNRRPGMGDLDYLVKQTAQQRVELLDDHGRLVVDQLKAETLPQGIAAQLRASRVSHAHPQTPERPPTLGKRMLFAPIQGGAHTWDSAASEHCYYDGFRKRWFTPKFETRFANVHLRRSMWLLTSSNGRVDSLYDPEREQTHEARGFHDDETVLCISEDDRVLVSGDGVWLVDPESGKREELPVDGVRSRELETSFRYLPDLRGRRIFPAKVEDRWAWLRFDPSSLTCETVRTNADYARILAFLDDDTFYMRSDRGIERVRFGKEGSELLFPKR